MGFCSTYKFKSTVGIKHIGARAWHDQLIDRIGPIRPPVRPSKNQSGLLQVIDHSVAGSMTAQPPGIRPSALRVATDGQQVAPLCGSYPSAEYSRQSGLFFSFDLWSLYLPMHFLSIWFSISSWWDFHSSVFHGIFDKLNDFAKYLVHFAAVFYLALRDHIICFL